MARLTGQKTLVGRMLDGFSGDVWFAAIYIAIALRLMNDTVPGTDVRWGIWIWALVAVAGLCCHSPQSSLADYYRQIHLYFLRGKDHAELDNSSQQRAVYETYKAQKIGWGNSSSIITLATVNHKNAVRRLSVVLRIVA